MSFIVLGLNHATAPLDVLEQVSIGADELDKALHDVAGRSHVSEAVIVSTCNRTEVYAVVERFHGAFADIRDFLAEQADLSPERISDHMYTLYDDEAVRHLFKVSAGVDSAVLGEHEILGQIKRSWAAAQEHGCIGSSLNATFRSALSAGKRVRTETAISRNIASVSAAAVALAEQRRPTGLAGQRTLIIGAGEMGAGLALTLADLDLGSLTVMSRSVETATGIANRTGATALPFAELVDAAAAADVIFTSTAATDPVISAADLARVAAERGGRDDLLVIDIALPRDVDPAAGEVDGIELLDLDAVNEFVARGLSGRAAELDDAQTIIDHEVRRHLDEVTSRSVDPLIASFRAQAEQTLVNELERHGAQLSDLTDEQRAAVDAITRSVLAKILHTPTVRLKESAATLRGERLAAAMRELFDLD